MAKYNIFQGKNGIRETVALAWGYLEQATPIDKWWNGSNGLKLCTSFTEDMYLSAFFYLSQRFGFEKPEEYKISGTWDFDVKDFTIRIELNSSWVEVMMFGEQSKTRHTSSDPYGVAYVRAAKKKRAQLVDVFRQEERTEEEIALINHLAEKYMLHKYPDKPLPDFFPEEEKKEFWMDYVMDYNNSVIGINRDEFLAEFGEIYSNAYTRRALRTLRSFLNNMLVPIWIRDVPYNIKGVCDDSVDYWRYENNIKFEVIKKDKTSEKT